VGCEAEIEVPDDAVDGEIVTCPDCGLDLEVKLTSQGLSVKPIEAEKEDGVNRENAQRCVELVRKTGTSDMNLFARAHNIPMIAYGARDSTLDHSENERTRLREYLDCIEVFAEAIERIAVTYRRHQLRPIPLTQ
jgi:acetylornithine deacetylase/succinyl-diaminopimelate desuccinylase-like protein